MLYVIKTIIIGNKYDWSMVMNTRTSSQWSTNLCMYSAPRLSSTYNLVHYASYSQISEELLNPRTISRFCFISGCPTSSSTVCLRHHFRRGHSAIYSKKSFQHQCARRWPMWYQKLAATSSRRYVPYCRQAIKAEKWASKRVCVASSFIMDGPW